MEWRDDIFREFTEEITTYMFPKAPEKIEETEKFISESMEKMARGEEIVCVILKREGKEYLGNIGLHKINTHTPEFGIWLKKSAHGHHYGHEAVAALKEWADTHLQYDHIVYPADRDNIPSRKIPESLGGTLHAEYDKKNLSGHTLHIVEYWIPRSSL